MGLFDYEGAEAQETALAEITLLADLSKDD